MSRNHIRALARFCEAGVPTLLPRRDPILGGLGDRMDAAINDEVDRRLSVNIGWRVEDAAIRECLARSAAHDAACLDAIERLAEIRKGLLSTNQDAKQ